jgi:hypothetical protein
MSVNCASLLSIACTCPARMRPSGVGQEQTCPLSASFRVELLKTTDIAFKGMMTLDKSYKRLSQQV